MADHPRSCGANTVKRPLRNPDAGSSPLVRGQRPERRIFGSRQRIIPARAGPTKTRRPPRGGASDHPRSCGANQYAFEMTCNQEGSSPLVRGQRNRLASQRVCGRIIPARAGPTQAVALLDCIRLDHPRSCGANLRSLVAVGLAVGSSPLVRGQPCRAYHGRAAQRIIPARAGPT